MRETTFVEGLGCGVRAALGVHFGLAVCTTIVALAHGCHSSLDAERRASNVATDQPGTAIETPAPDAAAVDALAARLAAVNEEVASSPERSVHGFNHGAFFRQHESRPRQIREVVMTVNVCWCDDCCVDGPAETPVVDDDLRLLTPFAASLEILDLQHCEITDAGLETIAELTQLRTLNLAGTKIEGPGLAALSRLTQLESLNLDETTVTTDHLSPLTELSGLKRLVLPSKAITDETLAIVGRLPALEEFSLAKSPATDAGVAQLAEQTTLVSLDVSETGITDAGLKHLARLRNLQSLNMSSTKITGDGLRHLRLLTRMRHLALVGTAVDDDGVEHLSPLTKLQSLTLDQTRVRGYGLSSLRECRQLGTVRLPPITPAAVASVNKVKSWDALSLNLTTSQRRSADDASPKLLIDDMPELTRLNISCDAATEMITVRNCPKLSWLVITFAEDPSQAAALELQQLPALTDIHLTGTFQFFECDHACRELQSLSLDGAASTAALKSISEFRSLERMSLNLTAVPGDAAQLDKLSKLTELRDANINLPTAESRTAIGILKGASKLANLSLRGQSLTAADLLVLEDCQQLERLTLSGVNDDREPLRFLAHMPNLDQCVLVGCPLIGNIRLTENTGLRRLYVNYGRLGEISVNRAPNLSAIYLGREAFGYRDSDMQIEKLGLGRLAVRNAPELTYLIVDAIESTAPLVSASIENCPQLRSLLLRATKAPTASKRCRLTATGTFPKLVKRRLFNLAIDQQSLDQLSNSPISRGGELDNVEVLPAIAK